jgi:hypothetical protein
MARASRFSGHIVAVALLLGAFCSTTDLFAYSVLAHQSAVDAAWDEAIVPLLQQRFPGQSAEQLARARAFAYGGAVIQDLGYYPFGSHLFTNLTHYVRSGDFVNALIHEAHNVDEYAFALGALAHYASDNAGHPIAVNLVVPMMYPKVGRKFGAEALYVDSPARHVMVEFAFDVSQVARGAYMAQAYRDRIGFEVSKPVLERAFHDTYGLELKDVLLGVDLAISTYRHAIGTTIPEMTRIAWRDKRSEIEERTPGMQESAFVLNFTRPEYEHEFGDKYRRPGFLSRIIALVIKIVPKIGPFRALAFQPLSAEAERLFRDSEATVHTRYRVALDALRRGELELPNTDFDTGEPPLRGTNALADETYVNLVEKHEGRKFAAVPLQLRNEIAGFFAVQPPAPPQGGRARKTEQRLWRALRALNAAAPLVDQ